MASQSPWPFSYAVLAHDHSENYEVPIVMDMSLSTLVVLGSVLLAVLPWWGM